MRALDWLARTTMLVLATLATLAMIGSLASVSNSVIGDAFPGEIATPVGDLPTPEATDPRIVESGKGTMTIESPIAAPRPSEHDIARWLKALTYAVLALAVFTAVGVIALVRIATHLRRTLER